MSEKKKQKRSVEHLRKYQFGQPGTRPGRRKGSRNKDTKLCQALLEEALVIDPDSGKQMSRKQLLKRLSKATWKSDKVLVSTIERVLGKVEQRVKLDLPVFHIHAPGELQESKIYDGVEKGEVIETYALPDGDNDASDEND